MGHHDDYKAKIDADARARIEKITLQLLTGMQVDCTDSYRKHLVTESIKMAKEFIKQIDELKIDHKRKGY